jgi:hypothetical protein
LYCKFTTFPSKKESIKKTHSIYQFTPQIITKKKTQSN